MQDRSPAHLRPRVLVIEDEPVVQDLVARVLGGQGFAVEVVATGWQGLLRVGTDP
jgi:CheY-like chemotaxis protein